MKMGKSAWLLFAVAPLLAGCGNFWQPPSGTGTGTGTCTTNCTTATSGNFYILNNATSTTFQVAGYSIVSGKMSALGNTTAQIGQAYSMAIAPNGKFLIVSTTSGVFAFPLTSGSLGTGVAVSTDQAYAIQVDSSNSWLVEAIQATNGVLLNAIPINSATGAFSGGTARSASFTYQYNASTAGVQTNQMAISANGNYIFLAVGTGGTLVVPFTPSSTTSPFGSSATEIPVLNSGGSALSVAVDPDSRLFYIGETLANSAGNSGGLRAITFASLGTSTLVQATGSPIASGGLAPNFILPVTTPDFVYVANGAGQSSVGNIAGFAVAASGATYSLTAGSTVTAGVQPLGLAEDSSNAFVFAVGSLGSPYFGAYTFDTTTPGVLDSQITSTTSNGSIAIVAAP
jgi:hypothetical protein